MIPTYAERAIATLLMLAICLPGILVVSEWIYDLSLEIARKRGKGKR